LLKLLKVNVCNFDKFVDLMRRICEFVKLNSFFAKIYVLEMLFEIGIKEKL